MTEQERRLELLEMFFQHWKAWCEKPSHITEQPLREIAQKLQGMEDSKVA